MDFEAIGAMRIDGALPPNELADLTAALSAHDKGRAGERLFSLEPIAQWVNPAGAIGTHAAALLGENARPVRAVIFDKNKGINWALGWHQDRTIAVRHRAEVTGFGPWTVKGGVVHVEPPFVFIERMLTIRVHLDDVGDRNAPLLVSPGTHRLGKLRDGQISDVLRDNGVMACLANAGDIWVYSTPILHASTRSESSTRRRVLQLDYSADELPSPLEWAMAS